MVQLSCLLASGTLWLAGESHSNVRFAVRLDDVETMSEAEAGGVKLHLSDGSQIVTRDAFEDLQQLMESCPEVPPE